MKVKLNFLRYIFLLLILCSCKKVDVLYSGIQYDVYKVVFESNGGTLISGKAVQYTKLDEEPIYPIYEKTMAEFIDFTKTIDEENKVITFTANYQDLTIKDLSPFELLDDITFGYNYVLGDVGDEDTDTGKIFDLLVEKNINAVAIPCRFYEHMDENFIIDNDYLEEIKAQVDEAIKRNLYCMLCFFDSTKVRWGTLDYDNYDQFMTIMDVQVKQIAEYFKGYNELVMFSFLGEPKNYNGYIFDKEAAHILNIANQKFIDLIRQTGGNNRYRNLVVSTGFSAYDGIGYQYFKMPNDNHTLVRVHAYNPVNFTLTDTMEETSWDENEQAYKLELLSIMKTINENFIQKGIPVFIGEFGSRDKNNAAERAKWLEYYVSAAYSYQIKCFSWESPKLNINIDYTFSLIDRYSYTWAFPEYTDKLESLIKDQNYIPFYLETYNYTQSIVDELIIPTMITNLLTNQQEKVEIIYDQNKVKQIDGKYYAVETGSIIFSYVLNDYTYYYEVTIVPNYEIMDSQFRIIVKYNDDGILQCFIETFGYSVMRVDYDWYSTDESILTINKYSSITIHNDGTCAIYAVHRETGKIGVVEVVIKNGKLDSYYSYTN